MDIFKNPIKRTQEPSLDLVHKAIYHKINRTQKACLYTTRWDDAMNKEKILTQQEILKRLGISLMTLYLWRNGTNSAPPLPVIFVKKPGWKKHRILIHESDLLRWLKMYRPDRLDKKGRIPELAAG